MCPKCIGPYCILVSDFHENMKGSVCHANSLPVPHCIFRVIDKPKDLLTVSNGKHASVQRAKQNKNHESVKVLFYCKNYKNNGNRFKYFLYYIQFSKNVYFSPKNRQFKYVPFRLSVLPLTCMPFPFFGF